MTLTGGVREFISSLKHLEIRVASTPGQSFAAGAAAGQAHAFITGGGTGIGAAIARMLARDGVRVTVAGRRPEPLEALATRVPGVAVATVDVTERASVDAALAVARAAQGPITILVANAGAAETAPFSGSSFETWRRLMSVNLDSLHHLAQAALPDLQAARHGRFIAIASTAGLKGYAYATAYSAAKHGVIGFTRALASELATTRVTVNAVCPGFTETELVARSIETIVAKSGRTPEAARSELAKFNPQGRLIQPDEVAGIVQYLCRPEAQSMTGQAIAVAGGEVM